MKTWKKIMKKSNQICLIYTTSVGMFLCASELTIMHISSMRTLIILRKKVVTLLYVLVLLSNEYMSYDAALLKAFTIEFKSVIGYRKTRHFFSYFLMKLLSNVIHNSILQYSRHFYHFFAFSNTIVIGPITFKFRLQRHCRFSVCKCLFHNFSFISRNVI